LAEVRETRGIGGVLTRQAVAAAVLGLLALMAVLTFRVFAADVSDTAELGRLLLIGSSMLAGVVFLHACLAFSVRSALVLLGLSVTISWVFEYLGQVVPIPFGATYQYHPALTPRIGGTVPVFICLSWFVLAYGPLVFLAGFASDWRGAPASRRVAKALLCSVGLMANDLCLDPLAVALGLWRWNEAGPYFGVPLGNYVGWIVVGFLIYLPFLAWGLDLSYRTPKTPSRLAAVLAATGLVLQVLVIAFTFRYVGSVVPALATGALKAPFTWRWIQYRRRQRALAARSEDRPVEALA
jgi:putative membrane protein